MSAALRAIFGRFEKSESGRTPMLRDDRGNTMIVAVGVLMIVGIIATSVWVKTLGGLDIASFEQKRFAAFSVANSGFDEALFRLEQWELDDMPAVGQIVFSGSGSTAEGDFSYIVTRIADRQWSIVATGTNRSDQSTRSIKAKVYTDSRYKHGIYTRDGTDLNGTPGDLCAFDSDDPDDADCPPDDTALLGSSGIIDCSGNGWDEISMTLYPPDGDAGGQCGEKGKNINTATSPYDFVPVTAPPPDAQVLPGCTVVSCTITPQMFASLPPGDYKVVDLVIGSGSNQDLCRRRDGERSITIYVTGSLSFASGVFINARERNGRGCTGYEEVGPYIDVRGAGEYAPTAPPSDFIVIQTCTQSKPAEIDRGQGRKQPVASMVLDAMCSVMTSNGGPHFLLFGAALLSEYVVNGSLKLLAWDRQLANLKQFLKYRVTDWREIPPVATP